MSTVSPKKPRIVILTTEQPHHVHFVREISKNWDIVGVIEEKRQISAKFETRHGYEEERNRYEVEEWFDGTALTLSDVADVQTFSDINSPEAVEAIKAAAPDVQVVFGTGKISQDVVDVTPDRIVSLHAADPEHYRGLDTHLWAVYHRDFRGLVVVLHKVSPQLERGGVVMKMPVRLVRDMQLYQFRKSNTDICVEITERGLEMFSNYGQFISQPQLYIGRHYSFMPAVLKERCINNFAEFTASL